MVDAAHSAFSQVWPAFALVAGLLLVGAAAARDGLFEAAGAAVARLPCRPRALLACLLGLEALVAAVLNLDTAVVFMTPVLLHAARRRSLAEEPFLYGAVFVANSASLLLPGSNLTNLIVLAHGGGAGSAYAARLAPAWAIAVAVTIAFVAVACPTGRGGGSGRTAPAGLRLGPGAVGIATAAGLMLAVRAPSLPVLGLGLAVAAAAGLRGRELAGAANPALLVGVLALAVGLGTIGREVAAVGRLAAGAWQTAWLAAGASLVANNLPAAVLLAAHAPAHPRALLLGLDLGPNLAVTGSLSAVLWLRVARRHGARPSALRYSLLGLALVPLTLVPALLVTA